MFGFVSTDLNVLDLHVLFCFCFIDARMLLNSRAKNARHGEFALFVLYTFL